MSEDMFEMPTSLLYNNIKPIEQRPEIIGLYCYIIRNYKPGKSLLIKRNKDSVGVKVCDWNGNVINGNELLGDYMIKLVNLMKTIRINQGQFYFADDGRLVDVRLSMNKMISPGMLNDLFACQLSIQEKIGIETMNEKIIDIIKSDRDKYGHNCIIKPIRSRMIVDSDVLVPLYATI